jgi:hypothetical protein
MGTSPGAGAAGPIVFPPSSIASTSRYVRPEPRELRFEELDQVDERDGRALH